MGFSHIWQKEAEWSVTVGLAESSQAKGCGFKIQRTLFEEAILSNYCYCLGVVFFLF